MDREFKIRITTTADPTGAQQTTGDLTKIGDATKEAGTQAEKTSTHSREMHRIFGQLNHIAPGLGEALHAVFRPELMGIMGAIIGIEAIIKLFEAAKKKAEETAQAAASVWIAQRDATEQAIEAAKKFNEEQKKTNDHFSQEEAVLKALLEQRKKLLGIEGQDEEAQWRLLMSQRTRIAGRGPALHSEVTRLEAEQAAARANLPSLEGRNEHALEVAAKKEEDVITATMKEKGMTREQAIAQHAGDYFYGRFGENIEKLAQYEKDRATVKAYDDLTLQLEKARKGEADHSKLLDEYNEKIQTATRVLGIHQQTETFTNATSTIQTGTPAQVRQLIQALFSSEASQKLVFEAFYSSTQRRAQAEASIIARLNHLESQLGNLRTH